MIHPAYFCCDFMRGNNSKMKSSTSNALEVVRLMSKEREIGINYRKKENLQIGHDRINVENEMIEKRRNIDRLINIHRNNIDIQEQDSYVENDNKNVDEDKFNYNNKNSDDNIKNNDHSNNENNNNDNNKNENEDEKIGNEDQNLIPNNNKKVTIIKAKKINNDDNIQKYPKNKNKKLNYGGKINNATSYPNLQSAISVFPISVIPNSVILNSGFLTRLKIKNIFLSDLASAHFLKKNLIFVEFFCMRKNVPYWYVSTEVRTCNHVQFFSFSLSCVSIIVRHFFSVFH